MLRKKRHLYGLLGPILYLLCVFFLPETIFSSIQSRSAIGCTVWMAFWWVLAPVDYAVTAFLPIAVNALMPMADMSKVIANYSSETILLLLGASILTVSWEITGLDRRIAAKFLILVGDHLRAQLVFWFILSAALSAVLPNAVVCATITPIAVAMLRYIGEGDIKHSQIASKLLLYIAYGVGVGGLASPLGGAMNLVAIEYLQQITGTEYMYLSWLVRFLPIMVVLMVSNIVFMLRNVKKSESMGGSREYFIKQYQSMPPMSYEEKWTLLMFSAATILSFSRQLYQSFLPNLKPAYVFIICAILSFFIAKSDGNRLILWKSIQGKIVWELIYMFAGGLAVGTLMNESGAAECLGKAMTGFGLTGGFGTVFIIIAITLLLSDITSNTATAAVAIPIIVSVINGIGLNPVPYVYIATIGVNLSYMLPTSIRAIPIGYGLEPKYMLKEGYQLTILVILLMTILAYLLLRFWPVFLTV